MTRKADARQQIKYNFFISGPDAHKPSGPGSERDGVNSSSRQSSEGVQSGKRASAAKTVRNPPNIESIRSNKRASAPPGGAPRSHKSSRVRDNSYRNRSESGVTYTTTDSHDMNNNNSEMVPLCSQQEEKTLLLQCLSVEQLFE